jgi:Spy/CpxP family protein refolding chaperone
MKKAIVGLVLLSFVVLGVTYAFARGPGFGPDPRGMQRQESWGPARAWNLTPDQETKFRELHRKFDAETAQLNGTILTKKLELQSLWSDPKADSKAILDKEKELRNLQNQMKEKRVQFKLEARQFLTPEQISEFGQGRGMGRGFGRGGYGKGRGYGMGPGFGAGPGYGRCQ